MQPQNTPRVELKTSEDGSSTLYRPDLDEHYHSIHGAIQESMHVFIQAGLLHHPATNLNILEVGFGTGLNALLTWVYQDKRSVFYHSLERYPLDSALVSGINYPLILNIPNSEDVFIKMHQSPWNEEFQISENLRLFKDECDLNDFHPQRKYDLIYFDAFGPDKQPELWIPEIFSKISNAMNAGAILVTYSCKGTVKRALKNAGLEIEKIPGPPGKREMLRAWKS